MDQPTFHYFMDHCEISPQFTQTGCTILLNTLENQLVLMKEIELNQDDYVDDMIDILSKQKELYHDHLLSLIDFYPDINQGKMIKFYQYCSHTLLQEIESRTDSNTPFTEEELENILVSGLKLLQYLEEAQIGHGCISPLDICLSDDLVKIVDPSIASSNPLQIVQGYYYSPQIMQSIVNGSQQDIDVFKNDVFSLAVCIIHCGLLNSCHDCYDYQRGQFIFDRLEDKVEQLNEIYSEKLVKVLIRMLDEDPVARPSSTQVLKLIEQQFEEQQLEQNIEQSYQEQVQYQYQQPHQQEQYQQYQQYQQYEQQYQHPNIYQNNNHQQDLNNQGQLQYQYQYQKPHEMQQSKQFSYLVEQSFNKQSQHFKQPSKNNQNTSSMANMNVSKTQQRLASMINRAKMNINKIRYNNSNTLLQ